MFKLKDFMSVLENYAPLELSEKMIAAGDYDNSGVIIESSDEVKKTLFTLDLSKDAVAKAKELDCDTVVTHHPAIYTPVKSLRVSDATAPLLLAAGYRMNVVSMHLNLDIADSGIDYCLSEGLEGKNPVILDFIDRTHGYGREAVVCETDAEDFISRAKKAFGTDKILFFGNSRVKKIASFCGGGATQALNAVENGITDADTIITSDMPHHVLKELVERGKNVMLLTHYASEQYGFNKFYAFVKEKTDGAIQNFYFIDKRFM